MIPQRFSILSAQTNGTHDQIRHASLVAFLKSLNFTPIECIGQWEYPEASILVPHLGEPEELTQLEYAAKLFNQAVIMHSIDRLNTLVMLKYHDTFEGIGFESARNADTAYTDLNGYRFRLKA